MTNPRAFVVSGVLLLGCTGGDDPRAQPDTPRAECDAPAARDVVTRFGEELQNVPLLAPDSIVTRALEDAYSPFVAPALLQAWVREPSRAPGREVSSPWPDRIAIDSVVADARANESADASACRVYGEVIYMASAGPAGAEPVEITLARAGDTWRISGYAAGPTSADELPGDAIGTERGSRGGAEGGADAAADAPSPATDAAAAADIIRTYYAAINDGRLRDAWELWRGDGVASGQTYEEFAAGYAETTQVSVELGEAGRIEGAAGSRYITLPVRIEARTTAGATQRFTGTYTLQRSVVDGATESERSWRIRSADIAQLR